MKTRPIDLHNLPSEGAILILKDAAIGRDSPVLVDHAIPGKHALRVLPPDSDDIELSGVEIANRWCEVVGDDAETLRWKYWPGTATLLVVGDKGTLSRSFLREIEKIFTVYTALDSDAALEVLATPSTKVDIVLSDFSLAGRDGLWLMEQVRAEYPSVRRLLACRSSVPDIETHVMAGLVERFFEAPATAGDVIGYVMGLPSSPDDAGSGWQAVATGVMDELDAPMVVMDQQKETCLINSAMAESMTDEQLVVRARAVSDFISLGNVDNEAHAAQLEIGKVAIERIRDECRRLSLEVPALKAVAAGDVVLLVLEK
jgi:CheY-like chemotaxis protein